MNIETIYQNVNILACTSELPEKDWIELRKIGIGGSDIAGILGISKYNTPLSIYMTKVTDVEQVENKHTKFGKRMEPVIREWICDEFYEKNNILLYTMPFPYFMQSKNYPFMTSNIDGLVSLAEPYTFEVNGESFTVPANECGILEIKTASESQWKQWENDSIPDDYYCQILWYMTVTGLSYAMIVALVGKELVWRFVFRDEEIINKLIETGRKFWTDYVEKKIPPAPMGMAADTTALYVLYPTETPEKMLDLSHMADKRLRYKEIAEEIKILQAEQEKIKQDFMAEMKDAELAFVGEHKITWKVVKRKEYVVKASESRQLRIY